MVSVMVPVGVPNRDCIGKAGAFLTLEGRLLKKTWYHLLVVYLIPQLPRTFEGHHAPCSQHHILAGCRIPAFSLTLLIDTKLPEPADKHVLTGCEGEFDEFQEGLDHFDGLIELASGFLDESFNNIVLSERHWRESSVFWAEPAGRGWWND